MTRYIVDANVWLAYFQQKKGVKDIIEESPLETPAVVVAEVTKALLGKGTGGALLAEILDYIREKSLIRELDFDHAVAAGKIAQGMGLHMADAIIYSYASRETPVLTSDTHFKAKPNVRLLEFEA